MTGAVATLAFGMFMFGAATAATFGAKAPTWGVLGPSSKPQRLGAG
jgi:hypothetical protein